MNKKTKQLLASAFTAATLFGTIALSVGAVVANADAQKTASASMSFAGSTTTPSLSSSTDSQIQDLSKQYNIPVSELSQLPKNLDKAMACVTANGEIGNKSIQVSNNFILDVSSTSSDGDAPVLDSQLDNTPTNTLTLNASQTSGPRSISLGTASHSKTISTKFDLKNKFGHIITWATMYAYATFSYNGKTSTPTNIYGNINSWIWSGSMSNYYRSGSGSISNAHMTFNMKCYVGIAPVGMQLYQHSKTASFTMDKNGRWSTHWNG
jgi:hypothetical protein